MKTSTRRAAGLWRAPTCACPVFGGVRLAVAGLVAALCVIAIWPTVATATFPGANGKIAFTRDGAIWTVNADGSGLEQLTKPPAGVYHSSPAWSPDGQRLAFERWSGGRNDIFTVRADDSGLRQITNTGATEFELDPAWSPVGRQIAFTRDRVVDGVLVSGDLYVIASDGTDERLIVAGNRAVGVNGVGQAAWSPTGASIIFSEFTDYGNMGFGSLFFVRPDGTNERPFPGLGAITGPDDSDRGASWSPDGARVAFTRTREGLPSTQHVAVIDTNGANLRILDGQPSSHPAWSPDGRTIVYSREGGLYLMGADGEAKRLLVRNASEPDWQAVIPPNPLPALSSITPAGVQAGRTTDLTLAVSGSGFRRTSVVRWNGESRPTTYVSSTRLNATIRPADLLVPGTAQVSVFTGAPGGGQSGTRAFTIASPTPGPTPAPQVLSAPLISGVAREGETLVCSTGSWSGSPTAFAWQWLRDGGAIAGATGPGHLATGADVGEPLTCRVSASNAGGTSSAVSAPVVPAPAPQPASTPPVAAPAPVAGPPSPAAVATSPALKILVSSALRVRQGALLRVKVVFSRAVRTTPIALQRRIGGRWVTVRARLVSGRSVLLSVRLTTLGRNRLRVVYLDGGVRRVSAVIAVRVIRR